MKRITEIYQKYEKVIDEHSGDGFMKLNFGPAHIVWEDSNFETHHIQWCIDHAEDYRRNLCSLEFDAVMNSLKELLTVPEEQRMQEAGRQGLSEEAAQ
jgi:hypothetical protein